jgi:hypothetical protein
MSFLLGDINFSSNSLTGPVSHSTSHETTIVQYPVNRGKPIPHIVGDELSTKQFSFFFDETFCNVPFNKAKLELAFATKSPLALIASNGIGFRGTRYIVESLYIDILNEDGGGTPVQISGDISLLEAPMSGGIGALNQALAVGRAIARSGLASINATVRR